MTKEEIGVKHGLMMHDPIQSYHIKNAMEEYAQSLLSEKWISVESGDLPKEGERVLLIVHSLGENYICIGKMKNDKLYYKDRGSMFKPMEVVTHWMPLPPLPSPPTK